MKNIFTTNSWATMINLNHDIYYSGFSKLCTRSKNLNHKKRNKKLLDKFSFLTEFKHRVNVCTIDSELLGTTYICSIRSISYTL